MFRFYLHHPFRALSTLLSLSFAVATVLPLFFSLELNPYRVVLLLPLVLSLFGVLKTTLFGLPKNKNRWWVELYSTIRDLPSILIWFYPPLFLAGGLAFLLLFFHLLPPTLFPPTKPLEDRLYIDYPLLLWSILLLYFYFLPLIPGADRQYSEQNEKEGRWEEGGVSYLYELQNYFVMDFHAARYLYGKRFGEEELDKYWQTDSREWYKGVRLVGLEELIPVAGPLSVRYRSWMENRRVEEEQLSGKKIPRSPFYARPTWESHLQQEEALLRKKEQVELLKAQGLWNEAEEREKQRIEREIEESWELFFKSSAPPWKESNF